MLKSTASQDFGPYDFVFAEIFDSKVGKFGRRGVIAERISAASLTPEKTNPRDVIDTPSQCVIDTTETIFMGSLKPGKFSFFSVLVVSAVSMTTQ
jgi:hypothetical protein